MRTCMRSQHNSMQEVIKTPPPTPQCEILYKSMHGIMVNLYFRCHCASLLEHTFYEAFGAGIRLCLKHENVSCKWTVVDPHCTRSAVDIQCESKKSPPPTVF